VKGFDHVKKEGDYVVLTVADSGVGISPQDMKQIFEPFYTKKVMGRSGTGLGMAVVWGTVKDHGGYIDVQSHEEKGTVFTLYFIACREGLSGEKLTVSIEDCRKIIKWKPGQKTIIASGFSETWRVKEVRRLGAGGYVKKPYSLEKIGFAVRKELDKPGHS